MKVWIIRAYNKHYGFTDFSESVFISDTYAINESIYNDLDWQPNNDRSIVKWDAEDSNWVYSLYEIDVEGS